MTASRVRRPLIAAVLAGCALAAAPAGAQQREPRIGPFVLDLRVVLPKFPSDAQLADSRGLTQTDLPGLGLGVDVGLHLYLFKWRGITFGIGGEAMGARAHHTPPSVKGQPAVGTAVTEQFGTLAPQISLNFGTGHGWSYLSGGIGQSIWSVVPDGQPDRQTDRERLRTVDYGGGGRWFIKSHLAFTFDVRFYDIDPGIAEFGFPGSPRTRLLVMGAGISLK